MAIRLGPDVLSRYDRFSLYNSPYAAHDEGCAIDLYPEAPGDGRTTVAPSPVSGVVRETRAVRAPPKPYAPERDHLIAIDCAGPGDLAGHLVRILHVEPAVEAGDRVEPGSSLGRLLRAGFFAPWVDNHLHVGVRPRDRDPIRASGSLPLEAGVDVRPLEWDGTGRVVETGETYAVLDAPAHPDPGAEFVGIGADGGGVVDGGLPHYDGGGLLGGPDGPVALAGERVGVADGRHVAWDDVVVTANGEPVAGLSLFCGRDAAFGAKLVGRDLSLSVGEEVRVRFESA